MPRPVSSNKYSAIHKWLRANYPKAGLCEHCGKEGKTHYAAKDHEHYTRDRADYLELCPRCHIEYDNRFPPSQQGVKLSPEHIAALQAGRRRKCLEAA